MAHESGCRFSGLDCERGCECWDGPIKCRSYEPRVRDWDPMEIDQESQAASATKAIQILRDACSSDTYCFCGDHSGEEDVKFGPITICGGCLDNILHGKVPGRVPPSPMNGTGTEREEDERG
jgi:hypothetical protein